MDNAVRRVRRADALGEHAHSGERRPRRLAQGCDRHEAEQPQARRVEHVLDEPIEPVGRHAAAPGSSVRLTCTKQSTDASSERSASTSAARSTEWIAEACARPAAPSCSGAARRSASADRARELRGLRLRLLVAVLADVEHPERGELGDERSRAGTSSRRSS